MVNNRAIETPMTFVSVGRNHWLSELKVQGGQRCEYSLILSRSVGWPKNYENLIYAYNRIFDTAVFWSESKVGETYGMVYLRHPGITSRHPAESEL